MLTLGDAGDVPPPLPNCIPVSSALSVGLYQLLKYSLILGGHPTPVELQPALNTEVMAHHSCSACKGFGFPHPTVKIHPVYCYRKGYKDGFWLNSLKLPTAYHNTPPPLFTTQTHTHNNDSLLAITTPTYIIDSVINYHQ